MAPKNLILYAATYPDADSAAQDYQDLKAAEGSDLIIVGSLVVSRDADGEVEVKESGDGRTSAGAVIGGSAGVVLGMFAPPLLAAILVGGGIGAAIGHFTKKNEEKRLGLQADEYLPPDTSAVIVIINDVYLDRVEKALGKAQKRINKAIDSGEYDQLKQAIDKSIESVGKAADS